MSRHSCSHSQSGRERIGTLTAVGIPSGFLMQRTHQFVKGMQQRWQHVPRRVWFPLAGGRF